MVASLKRLITFQTLFCLCLLADSKKPSWTYEILEVDVENQTPEVIIFSLQKNLVSRGLYKFNGQIDVKQDLTDDFRMEVDIYNSRTGSKNYVRTPFRIPPTNLSQFLNTFYKDIFMESVRNCSDHMPFVETTFEPPLTKRLITFDNCLVSNDRMPSYMTPGYYRFVLRYSNQAQGTLTVVSLIVTDY